MERNTRSRTPPSPGTDSLEQLKQQQRVLAAQQRDLSERIKRREQAILEQQQTTNVIVAASPSPRKATATIIASLADIRLLGSGKRARASLANQPPPPLPPAFYDSTLAGPPVSDAYGKTSTLKLSSRRESDTLGRPGDNDATDGGLQDLLQKETKRKSLPLYCKRKQNPRHLTACFAAAKSKFVTGLVGISSARSDSQKKKQQRERRSTEFATPCTTTTAKLVEAPAEPTTVAIRKENEKTGMMRQQQVRPSSKSEARTGQGHEQAAGDASDADDDLDVVGAPVGGQKRRKDGTVVESLQVGPFDHVPPKNDPDFETIEPNSGIRLIPGSRVMPHDQVQAHLDGRYHLTPSLVNSLARKELGTDVIDIDVDGDFVLIGVLAWKGPIKVMNPSAKQESKHRKCLRFTLVDLRSIETSRNGSSVLSVLLFEAESVDEAIEQDGWRAPQYRGGSGGAYEKFWKESPGAVVAILNPKMLRARQEPGQPFSPYTLTLSSANSMMVIGRARDLGSCSAIKANGNKCDEWCDVRDRKVCEFHLHRSVKSGAARRPEMNASTNSLSASASMNAGKFAKSLQKKPAAFGNGTVQPAPRKTTCDPVRKTGLLPDKRKPRVVDGAETYMTTSNGALASSSKMNIHDQSRGNTRHVLASDRGFVRGVSDGVPQSELLRQNKLAERKKKEDDLQLRQILSKDMGESAGAQYLKKLKASKDATETFEASESDGQQEEFKGSRKRGGTLKDDIDSDASGSGTDTKKQDRKRPFGSTAVRLIGFDPTNQRMDEDEVAKRQRNGFFVDVEQLDIVSSLLAQRPPPSLSAPPGPKVRSGVVAPVDEADERRRKQEREREMQAREQWFSQDEDDDLVVEGGPAVDKPVMVKRKAISVV
ncbi:hypothetical protein OIV83_003819 [Microbotryomycetes sp. JL201]|nr:hypothetical protein OIV83_003819 [Microbotryomycetes sp. JL201]